MSSESTTTTQSPSSFFSPPPRAQTSPSSDLDPPASPRPQDTPLHDKDPEGTNLFSNHSPDHGITIHTSQAINLASNINSLHPETAEETFPYSLHRWIAQEKQEDVWTSLGLNSPKTLRSCCTSRQFNSKSEDVKTLMQRGMFVTPLSPYPTDFHTIPEPPSPESLLSLDYIDFQLFPESSSPVHMTQPGGEEGGDEIQFLMVDDVGRDEAISDSQTL